ncbi:amino acid adenylation domain-containing protein [Pseudoalteromonas sp. T1lg65]|uniref:amino acid adenylation domain-containing protein n=1 Tax=Pseudoalteromonas sp. T1lg65 TaxID=2077101 RepID=UPI003F793CE1
MLNLCQTLANDNIAIWANGDKLKIAHGDTGLSQQWISWLKDNKNQLLAYLNKAGIVSEQDFNTALKKEQEQANNIRAIYPATAMQKGFVYHHLAQPNDDAYRVQLVIDYQQSLDLDLYKKAWILASVRYPALRLAFNWDDEIIQVIKGGAGFTEQHFTCLDFSADDAVSQEQQLQALLAEDRLQPFDLAKPGLMRFYLIKRSAEHYTLIKTEHHSISDGWSFPVMLQTVHQNYAQLQDGIPVIVEEETAYLDAQALYKKEQSKSESYWQQEKANFGEPNDVNRLLTKNIDLSGSTEIKQAGECQLVLKDTLYQDLKAFSQQHGWTMNVLMQFAWHKVLQVYCQDQQTLVGTTVSGRELPVDGIHASVGLYINTLPLALDWHADASVAEQLQTLKDKIAQMNGHSSIALSQLQEPNSRLFNSLFVFENYPTPAGQDVLQWSFNKMVEKVDYPLTISVVEQQNVLLLKLSYCQTTLVQSKAQRLLEQVQMILQAIIADPQQNHQAISLVTEQDQQRLIANVDEQADYHSKTIHQLFAEQVQRTPNSIALVEGECSLTYTELADKALQLAQYIDQHIKVNASPRFVGLFCSRSIDMVIAKLAILQAGCAYVPLNPEYPDSRIQYMLDDTQTSLILTESALLPRIESLLAEANFSANIAALDTLELENSSHVIDSSVSVLSEAYVIYTSGTTGEPKGVVVPHQGVVSLVQNTDMIDCGEQDVFIHLSNPNFDAATFEIWAALLSGAKLVVAPSEVGADPDALSSLIKTQNITVLWITRTLFDSLFMQRNDIYDGLRCVITGGEAMTPAIAREVLARHQRPNILINAYGPTESTTFATFYNAEQIQPPVPIGTAINHRHILLLDTQLNPVAQGVAGEIYIAGPGLALEYLNKPEMTAARFIDNPFVTEQQQRVGQTKLYKTGDLARWSETGQLEFLGRNDHQVKIRGFRIELSEIEAQLNELAAIKQAAVTVYEQAGNKQLVAYVVPQQGDINVEAIKAQLAEDLPTYMIPSYFEQLNALPVNNNGKLDQRKLPKPTINTSSNFQAAGSELEQQLCGIWQQVLGLESVGVNDDFFKIGGDSIVSIQLVSTLRKAGFNLQVKDVISAPTIKAQAHLITFELDNQVTIQAEQGLLSGNFTLLPIQQWFFDQQLPHPQHWNQAFTINLPANITPERVKDALHKLAEHHDMLRCQFVQTEQGVQQCYHPHVSDFELPLMDMSELSKEQRFMQLTELQSRFDLYNGPLWCAAWLCEQEQPNQLFFACHHALIDVVSWRLFNQDLQTLLQGNELGDKLTSYRQWVDAIATYPQANPQQRQYWQQVQQGYSAFEGTDEYHQYQVALDPQTTTRLLREANQGLNTDINDLLLSALGLALSKTFANTVNHIQLEGHGREAIADDLDVSNTLGWFTSMYPVKLETDEDITTLVANTKEMLRQLPDKGVGYGAFCQAGLIDAITPQVSFNYLGQLNQSQQQASDWLLDDSQAGYVMTEANAKADTSLLLNINGAIRGAELSFNVVSRFDQHQSLAFTEHFKVALEQVIDAMCELANTTPMQTPSDFGLQDVSFAHYQQLQQQYQIETLCPANSLQQGFVSHAINFPDDDAYRVQLVMDIEQDLQVEQFIEAWRLASVRFPILRTAFDWQETMLQVVSREASIGADNFVIEDLSALSHAEQETSIAELQAKDRLKAFDLTRPGLIRFMLIKRSESLYTMIKTEHHTINDGWSGPLMLQAVGQYYQQLCAGQTPVVEAQSTYIDAQRFYQANAHKTQAFWQQQQQQFGTANDISSLLDTSLDLSQMKTLSEVSSARFTLTGAEFNKLQRTCQQAGVTLNVALQFAWHKLLQTFSGDEQTIVGSTVSGREIPVTGIEQAVGLFINTLPLVVNWQSDLPCAEILKSIQKGVADLNSYSDISLSKLQRDGQRLFHTLFVFENYPTPENTGAWKFRESIEKGDYPLSVVAQSEGDTLEFVMHYNPEWLTSARAEFILAQVQSVLAQLPHCLTQNHHAISLVTPEMHSTLKAWHDNAEPFSTEQDVASLVEQHAELLPDAVAVKTSSGLTLTYRELNQKANALAELIVDTHPEANSGLLPANTPIAMYLSRGAEMLISMLAIIKAGGAYVPVSPDYPSSRVEFILSDTGTKLVLTQAQFLNQLQPVMGQAEDLWVDAQELDLVEKNPTRPHDLSRLAYIIYTSGTTGQPKGVMLSQHNVLYYLHAITSKLGEHYRNIDFSSNYCFDLSVTTTLCPLLAGQTVCVFEGDILDAKAYQTHLQQQQVGFVKTTPSLAVSLLPDSPCHVPALLLGGEALTKQAIATLAPHVDAIFDEYGPTEATVGAMLAQAYPRVHQGIGRAYPNVNLHVLNDALKPLPIGAPGELYISGAGVAAGYLNRDELNQERFIANPFNQDPAHAKLYKTGDLVRWLESGDLVYLGRNDEQVKIRGYRVELGEIAAALNALPNIKQAVVVDVKQQGGKALAAYLVTDSGNTPSVNELRAALEEQLPEYMVPSSFTFLEQIPLTGNGKLNRAALPAPALEAQSQYVAPRNDMERTLCEVWQQILGIEQVGIEDNFFRIGGDSISAIRLMNACNKALDLNIPIAALFEHTNIAAIVANVDSLNDEVDIKAEVQSQEQQTNSLRI